MQSLHLCHHYFSDDLFLGSCPNGVYRLYPAELIAGLEVFSYAFGFCEPGGNEVDLFISLTIDVDEADLWNEVLAQNKECSLLLCPHRFFSKGGSFSASFRDNKDAVGDSIDRRY